MADGNLPDIETLRKLLAYDPETGVLTWLPRPVSMFGRNQDWLRWSARYAGMPAFTADDGQGYRHGAIFGRKYRAHRVAWALHHGEWPVDQIDHENGDRADNRIANLRSVTNAENGRNQKRSARNASGVIGVHWFKTKRKWRAAITVAGVSMSLGYFARIEDACEARDAAERRHGFNSNHGRTS